MALSLSKIPFSYSLQVTPLSKAIVSREKASQLASALRKVNHMTDNSGKSMYKFEVLEWLEDHFPGIT